MNFQPPDPPDQFDDIDARMLWSLGEQAKMLIEDAKAFGYLVTIEQRPLKPLAMTNAETVVTFHPDRRHKNA